jgi:hypothetical protein
MAGWVGDYYKSGLDSLLGSFWMVGPDSEGELCREVAHGGGLKGLDGGHGLDLASSETLVSATSLVRSAMVTMVDSTSVKCIVERQSIFAYLSSILKCLLCLRCLLEVFAFINSSTREAFVYREYLGIALLESILPVSGSA